MPTSCALICAWGDTLSVNDKGDSGGCANSCRCKHSGGQLFIKVPMPPSRRFAYEAAFSSARSCCFTWSMPNQICSLLSVLRLIADKSCPECRFVQHSGSDIPVSKATVHQSADPTCAMLIILRALIRASVWSSGVAQQPEWGSS